MSDNVMSGSVQPRVFLVVVDESEEYRVAVHYAARRAAHTGGRLALLYVLEPAEMQQWMAIEELARAELRTSIGATRHKRQRRALPRHRQTSSMHISLSREAEIPKPRPRNRTRRARRVERCRRAVPRPKRDAKHRYPHPITGRTRGHQYL